MKSTSCHRSDFVRNILICLVIVPAFLFVSGCCTCEVKPYHAKTLLIVKQADELDANKYEPEGALLGFSTIKPGEKLLVINKYGKGVTVDFPANIVEGERTFEMKKCKSRTVTIKSDITVITPFTVEFLAGDDLGGADMIVDPG